MIPSARFRVSIGTLLMFAAAAVGLTLFLKIRAFSGLLQVAGLRTDAPVLLLLAIGLTTIAFGSWKEHSASQILLQGMVVCLGCLSLIWISEAGFERTIRYWFQATFALTVAIPLLLRRYVKAVMPRGPRRDWWKKTCEAFFFAFLGILLVSAGGLLQVLVSALAYDALKNP